MESLKAEKFIYNKLKKQLPKHLYYHSIHHVEDVLNAATTFAKLEKISDEDFQVLKIAVLFHDSGFTVGVKDHEINGCELVKQSLPKFGFTQKQIDKICGMIMATKIPQTPKNHLEEIICDADLDYLGRDDYDMISNNLYKEINMYSMLEEVNWMKLQISFLESHHYFTASAIKMRKKKKTEKLNSIKKKLEKLLK